MGYMNDYIRNKNELNIIGNIVVVHLEAANVM